MNDQINENLEVVTNRLFNSVRFKNKRNYSGLKWSVIYNKIHVDVIYGKPCGKKLLILDFYYNNVKYSNYITDSKYLTNVDSFIDKLMKDGRLTDFYDKLTEDIQKGDYKVINDRRLTAYITKCNLSDDQHSEEWQVAESYLIDIDRYYKDIEDLDNKKLKNIYEYIEKYGVITDNNLGALEYLDHHTKCVNKIIEYLEGKGVSVGEGAIFRKENSTYGFGEIFFLYDKDLIPGLDDYERANEVKAIVLAIARKYMEDNDPDKIINNDFD